MTPKSKIEPLSMELEANGKPVMVTVDQWRNNWYLSARYYYQSEDGTLRPGKNGININISTDEGIHAAQAIVNALQDAINHLTKEEDD